MALEISNPGAASTELLLGAETILSSKPGGIGVGVSIACHLAQHVGGNLSYRCEDGTVVACLTLGVSSTTPAPLEFHPPAH